MLRRIQILAINVTSAIMLAVLAWQLCLHAADMYSYNAISPFLSIPMAPVATLMAAMAGTTAAVLLCLALRALLPPWPSAGTCSMAESLIGFAVMLVLAFARMPIAFGLMIVVFFGLAFLVNWANRSRGGVGKGVSVR